MSLTLAGGAPRGLDQSDTAASDTAPSADTAVGLLWVNVLGGATQRRYVAPPDGIIDVVAAQRGGVLSLRVAGASATVSNKNTSGLDFAIVARLRAGVAPVLFGVPARAVAESALSLDSLWPAASGLLQRLIGEPSVEHQAACLKDALDTRYRERRRARDSVALLERALRGIDVTCFEAAPSVSAIARRLGISERTLRRAFDDGVGLSPRTVVALSRLRRALRLLTTTHPDGAAIAACAGYCDQSHLIRDFRRYMYTTPEHWRHVWAKSPPIVRPFLDLTAAARGSLAHTSVRSNR